MVGRHLVDEWGRAWGEERRLAREGFWTSWRVEGHWLGFRAGGHDGFDLWDLDTMTRRWSRTYAPPLPPRAPYRLTSQRIERTQAEGGRFVTAGHAWDVDSGLARGDCDGVVHVSNTGRVWACASMLGIRFESATHVHELPSGTLPPYARVAAISDNHFARYDGQLEVFRSADGSPRFSWRDEADSLLSWDRIADLLLTDHAFAIASDDAVILGLFDGRTFRLAGRDASIAFLDERRLVVGSTSTGLRIVDPEVGVRVLDPRPARAVGTRLGREVLALHSDAEGTVLNSLDTFSGERRAFELESVRREGRARITVSPEGHRMIVTTEEATQVFCLE